MRCSKELRLSVQSSWFITREALWLLLVMFLELKPGSLLSMRFDLFKVLAIVISVGLLLMPSLVSTATAEETKTCADGKPCPTDSELEDSCSDEVESL